MSAYECPLCHTRCSSSQDWVSHLKIHFDKSLLERDSIDYSNSSESNYPAAANVPPGSYRDLSQGSLMQVLASVTASLDPSVLTVSETSRQPRKRRQSQASGSAFAKQPRREASTRSKPAFCRHNDIHHWCKAGPLESNSYHDRSVRLRHEKRHYTRHGRCSVQPCEACDAVCVILERKRKRQEEENALASTSTRTVHTLPADKPSQSRLDAINDCIAFSYESTAYAAKPAPRTHTLRGPANSPSFSSSGASRTHQMPCTMNPVGALLDSPRSSEMLRFNFNV